MREHGRRLYRIFLSMLFAIAQSGLSQAESLPGSTLERIRQTQTLRIGYGITPPFSYIGPNGRVMGYSIELCERVAQSLRVQLGLQRINIEYVFRTPSNRVQLLNSGMMDIECVASSNNAERRRRVTFTRSHFLVTTYYVSLAKNNLRTLADLRGRSVSVALGTVNVSQITQMNREKKLNLSIIAVDTLQKAFELVGQEKASAFAMDDILLHTMIAASPNPQDYALSSEPVSEQVSYGFMVRLDDDVFRKAVNTALNHIFHSADMESIYARWFTQPLPGSGINLNWPMSDSLKAELLTRE
ncbi:amino acid ABC transporter substrate-binding protein [Brenneria izbisi]|uniref:Amino acid ABC transporter substrate-binding protein n=1 Tax=Brenneria izbisi TaxID=2939450 RepID=A0AA41XXU9_9GAMM|nr:amino acid ABC transporter substrate-binding protein [Brenneria izbisi]MCV9879388.1 amino acid ABC transporter substrate-binding protein [Brenneria izbisi]MCV9882588.1 amino acid ABC transporter substrate-binding protein [Brenneria izbisi]